MTKQMYYTLESVQAVQLTLAESRWSVWAHLAERDDREIHAPEGVRQYTEGGLVEINAGEWSSGKGYLNEEWIKPLFIFAKHPCADCHYPPHMCCLQPSDFRSPDDYDRLGYLEDDASTDDEIMESDAYGEALESDQPPAWATLREIEV